MCVCVCVCVGTHSTECVCVCVGTHSTECICVCVCVFAFALRHDDAYLRDFIGHSDLLLFLDYKCPVL